MKMRAVVLWLGLSLLVSASALSLSKTKKTKAKKTFEHFLPSTEEHTGTIDLFPTSEEYTEHHLLPLWPDHEGHDDRPRRCHVGIIGGGISGLYMAYEILKVYQTEKICVFEKERDLGGRILDHRFDQAQNIAVGMGAWRVDKHQTIMINLLKELGISYSDWTLKKPHLYKSRGISSKKEEDIKKAYPALEKHPKFGKMDSTALYKYLINTPEIVSQADKFPTFYSYASNMTTSEGAHFMHDFSHHKGEIQELVSPVHFIDFLKEEFELSNNVYRPDGGMSAIIDILAHKVNHMGGHIYTRTTVRSITKMRKRPLYILKTSKSKVKVDMVVVAVPPGQFRKIKGQVARKIQRMPEFKSIIPIPAFKGAAIYRKAWWKNVKINGTPIVAGQQFVSQDDCLGVSLAYRGSGRKQSAVLHTIYTDGHCARKWRDIGSLGKRYLDEEVHRALESKYGVKIPKPLDTDYQYWNPAWHFQKSGSKFSVEDVVEWAKRPIPGMDIFLVGEAFGPNRAWCQGAIVSSRHALEEGWAIESEPPHGTGDHHYYIPAHEIMF